MSEGGHMWYGMVCTNCKTGFESSPTNAVSVTDFEFCPMCGNGSSLHYREIEKQLGVLIDDYLAE